MAWVGVRVRPRRIGGREGLEGNVWFERDFVADAVRLSLSRKDASVRERRVRNRKDSKVEYISWETLCC